MISEQKVLPDFILINESWSNSAYSDVFFKIDGFNLVCRYDRSDTNQGVGGGLLLWCRDKLSVAENKSPEFESFNQCCSVKVPLAGGSSIALVLVYRPHNLYNSPVTEKANNEKLCSVLENTRGSTVYIGDFNYSDIDWTHFHAAKPCSRDFLNTVQDCFLTQHIDFATRASSGTIPDLVLSSDSSLVHGISDIGKLGSSDHSMLPIEVAGELTGKATTEEVPDWGKADMEKLREELGSVDWVEELQGLDTDQSWDKFKERLAKAQDNAVPKKRRRINSKPIWMTKNTIRVIRKKRRLWKVYRETKDHAEYTAYKKVEKEVKDAVRKAKKKFERNLAKDARRNPKAFYSYLKSKTSNRQSVGPLKENNEVVTDDKRQAEILNLFFTSVFTKEDLENVPVLEPVYSGNSPLNSVPFHRSWSRKRSKSYVHQLRLARTKSARGYCRGWWMLSVFRWPSSTQGLWRRGWYRTTGDVLTSRRCSKRVTSRRQATTDRSASRVYCAR